LKDENDDIWKGYEDFLNCTKTAIRANLSKELNCVIPGFNEFLGNDLDLKECSDNQEGFDASKKYQAILFDFYQNPEHFVCKFPCERNSYTVEQSTYHFNSILWEVPRALDKDNYYHLFFYYRSTSVEKQVEVLIYDLGGFIAAAGGNLGLCLGFSCLSILFAITHWTKAAFGWIKEYTKQ
jgi:hypothetical protein